MPEPVNTTAQAPALSNNKAWDVIKKFASGTITLPAAEEQLKSLLGSHYKPAEWKPAIDAVFLAEDDDVKALTDVTALAAAALQTNNSPTHIHQPSIAVIPQLQAAEATLLESVSELKQRNRIFGTAPTLEELLNPVEEQDIGEPMHLIQGENDEEIDCQIVKAVRKGAETHGSASDSDSDSDEDDKRVETEKSLVDSMKLCEELEKVCLLDTDLTGEAFDLSQMLRRYRGQLFKREQQSRHQVTLDKLWGGR